MNRREEVQEKINSGDIAELLRIVEYPPCACRGAVDDEPFCRCQMSSLQVRANVSLSGLKRGLLLYLKPHAVQRFIDGGNPAGGFPRS